MPQFGKTSLARLSTCDARLQMIANAAIERTDFTVLCGYRGEKDQNDAYDRGASKLKYPQSKHNKWPSHAMDLAPFPIDWDNIDRFKALMAIVAEEAHRLGVKVRFGWDWNGNGKLDDRFRDWPHVEIAE